MKLNKSLKKYSSITPEQRKAIKAIDKREKAILYNTKRRNDTWSPLWPEDQYKKRKVKKDD